jgi:hypothetical protein
MRSQDEKVVLPMARYLVMHGQLILLFLLDAFTLEILDLQYLMLFSFPTEVSDTISMNGHKHPFNLKSKKNCSIFSIPKLEMPSTRSLKFTSGALDSSHHAQQIP